MSQSNKRFDVICMGRVAVDLYGQQIGSRLEDMTTFSKYLGGSSGNVAYGTALQGLKSSMLARVGDEHMGRFVREELDRLNVDTSNLITDKERLTALVILGIKDEETFPLIFYRENCADMAITSYDISEEYIASSNCLAITGTHLSNTKTRGAVLTALEYANKHGVKTVLDIDYRPVLWGLTSIDDGETRFVESESVTEQLQELLGCFDVIVGTEEEFHIAGGSIDTLDALKAVRKNTSAVLVCKRGPQGCSVYETAIPDHIDGGINVKGVQVEVLNVLGAGDAFMSGLLRGYLNQEGWHQACAYANACGALVVSRHGCSPAMPSKAELDDYLSRSNQVERPDLDETINHLHRVTTRKRAWRDLFVLAFDHRSQFEEMVAETNGSLSDIPKLKSLILEALDEIRTEYDVPGDIGLLCDGTYGQASLNASTGSGLWIARPIELPSSRPLRLEHGNIGSQLVSWPIEHIVKCLVFYHPNDDSALREQQEETLLEVYHACCQSGHELLIELILPSTMPQDDEYLTKSIERLYDRGIKPDWWKLPGLKKEGWLVLEEVIRSNDEYCHGVVVLGLDKPLEDLSKDFEQAKCHSIVKGFAVGRSIFRRPSQAWFSNEIDDKTFKRLVKVNYANLISVWVQRDLDIRPS